MQAMTIEQLVAARIAAKREEDKAVEARREIDAQIAAILADPGKPEGAVSRKLDDGTKVTATFTMTRKVDSDKLQADWAKLPLDVQNIFKWKADVSVTEMRKLEGTAVTTAARYYETKPGSTSIKIEV